MDHGKHRPTFLSRLRGTPRCSACGHLAPCPTVVEAGRGDVDDLEAAERLHAFRRLAEFSGLAFTEGERGANPGGHW